MKKNFSARGGRIAACRATALVLAMLCAGATYSYGEVGGGSKKTGSDPGAVSATRNRPAPAAIHETAVSGPDGAGYYLVTDSLRARDSIRMIEMQSIQVTSTRATAKTPIAYSTVAGEQLRKVNTGADLPFLLQMTPSLVVTSDAGAGVGYTSVRIRGTDATRINVTANGIPMNDAESHSLFWVNTPDMAASVEDIQVQRGVGTSTNGAGAFGGSINMRTQALTSEPFAEFSGSYGSYNTHRQSVNVSSGLLGKFAFNARLSNIGSDGYIDRASTKLKSYLFQAGYYGRNTTLKFITFGGKEETYHAWNGLTREQMAVDRRYNPSGEIESVVLDAQGRPTFNSDGSPVTEVTGFYDDQTDNYLQTNYQLLFTQRFSQHFDLNVIFHFTNGDGYYEEYRNARTLEEYALTPFTPADPSLEAYYDPDTRKVTKSNLVRRKKMDNWFGGGVFSLNYRSERLQASLGGAANKYDGDHFGQVIWVQNYSGDPQFAPGHEYYRNKGTKLDMNVYLKATWEAARDLHIFGDVQYRRINYKIEGANDNWDWNVGAMQQLDVDNTYNFFNPKAGLMYDFLENWNAYASVAVAHREPTRNNFTDARSDVEPRSERLIDYEAGASYRSRFFSAGVNLYYMKYKDQLVLTGEVNHIGEPLADNVDDSYRAGIELTASAQFTPWLRWDLNATFSRNRISGYTEYLDDMDENYEALYTQTANYIGGTDISFSPDIIMGSIISAEHQGWSLALLSNFVSSQYMTNSMQDDVRLGSYFLTNVRLGYQFTLPHVKSVAVGFTVNNIFNRKYASNGYGGSSNIIGSEGSTRENWAYFFPQAGTNVMANVVLRF